MKLLIDNYIIDVLMRDLAEHEKRPSAFLIYLHLWRHTYGDGRSQFAASYKTIAESTGLSKSAVQGAVALLKRRKLISVGRETRTATPVYSVARPWVRKGKHG